MMADAVAYPQVQELGWQPVEDQRSEQQSWSRLHQDLARALDGLYVMCETDWHADLVLSTLQYLEQSVNDFRQATQGLQHPNNNNFEAASLQCQYTQQQAEQHPRQQMQQQPQHQHQRQQPKRHLRSPGSTDKADRQATNNTAEPVACSQQQARANTSPAGSPKTAVSAYIIQQHVEACSSNASLADDNFSSCSSSSSNSSCFSSCNCSKSSTVSSTSSGTAWQGQVNWTKVFDAPSAAVNGLHHKLSSPYRLRKSPSQTKAAAEERQARAERLRTTLAEGKLARLKQDQLAKQQKKKKDDALAAAARSADKHQRSELLRAAHIGRIKAKALDETRKVEEVTFINTLNNEGKKADLQQRLEEGEARRAEALAAILAKQQGAAASVKEAAERRRQAEAERQAQLAERLRRKQEAKAKMEEERRAAAAVREAAKTAAHAVTQQREAARQQHADLLSSRINARLKEAAQRRLKHLELIRERAALGKDFERRDSLGAISPGSRSQSPAGFGRQQQPAPVPARPLATATALDTASTTVKSSRLNAAAQVFCPKSTVSQCSKHYEHAAYRQLQVTANMPSSGSGQRQSSSQLTDCEAASSSSSSDQQHGTRGASPVPTSPAAAAPLPAVVLQQLKGNSQSVDAAGITPAGNHKNSIKGARRRMARCRRKLLEPGTGCFCEPQQALQLTCSPDAQQLLATWAPHLALLNVQPPQLRSMQQACRAGALVPAPAGILHHQTSGMSTGSCGLSGKGTRSSSSGGGSSPQQPCSGHSRCRCSSSGTPASTCRLAATERYEALAVLVRSARANLAKLPLVVCHLARQTGLLHLLCKEVLSAAGGAAQHSCGEAAADAGATTGRRRDTILQPKARQDTLQEARMLELLVRLLDLPTNLDYLLGSGPLLPGFARAMLAALDHCNSLEADEPAMMTGGEAASRLSVLLQVLVAVLEHPADSPDCTEMQEELVGFMVAAGTVGRLASVFSLFDQPMKDAARPVPPHVLQCLRLLRGLTAVRRPDGELLEGKRWPTVNANAAAIIMELQATAMAGVLSLLTAVLLNASPTCTPAEASSKALPPNFVEAAYLVMSVLNNVCRLDLLAAQHMLGCAHNRLEFFHLISFLLSYCSSRWPAGTPAVPAMQLAGPISQPLQQQKQREKQQQQQQGKEQPTCEQHEQQPAVPEHQNRVAVECQEAARAASRVSSSPGGGCGNSSEAGGPEASRIRAAVCAAVHHPIAELLNQVLLLIGYFCVQHPSNQAILQWGRSPTILQRLCDMPSQYYVVPEPKAVAMPTLLSVCYGADRACELLSQHVGLELVLQYVQQQQQSQIQQQREGSCKQAQQGPQQQQISSEVTNPLQQLAGPPDSGGGHSPSGGGRVSLTSSSTTGIVSSDSLAQFQMAKRFPLPALEKAQAYLLQLASMKQVTAAAAESTSQGHACGLQAAALQPVVE